MPTEAELAAQAAAEEAKKKGGADDGAADKGSEADAEAQERQAVEAAARAKGWKPKPEYTGEPGAFIDAKEFLGREPLFTALKESRRETKELRKTVDAMVSSFQKTVDGQVKVQLAKLQEQKREAIKEGDVEKVEAIDKQIDQTRAAKADAPTANQVAPEVKEWVDRNPWFTADPELHEAAIALNDAYLKRNPGDLTGMLAHVEARVKKLFPEKFPKPPGGDNGADKGDGAGKPKAGAVEGATMPSGAAKKYDVRRLTPDQKRVYEQMVKPRQGEAVLSHDEYFKGLEAIGELQ